MNGQFKITKLFAYIATDEDGTEGVPAFLGRDGISYPLIGADVERCEQYRPIAESIAKNHKKKIVLAVFSIREDQDMFLP